ncbi:MAG: hypothetical protein ACI39R_05165 [Lachnospiraceae bacterium]
MTFKKKKAIILFLAVLILLAVAAITIAFMFKKSETATNEFVPAQVSCQVIEMFDGTEKSSIKVKNSGNTFAWLRIHLVSYWVDEDGNVVGKASEMPELSYDTSNWIKGSGEVYYYTQPVAAGDTTENDLLTAPLTLKEDSYNGVNVYQVIELFAEAIQSKPNDAVTDSWNVTISDGKITAVP